MKRVKELINKLGVSVLGYKIINNRIIINTDNGRYVIKKNKYIDKDKLFNYLESRKFIYFLKPIYSNKFYDIYPYIKENNLSLEEKYYDLISIVSYLHLRTIFYKKLTEEEVNDKYDEIKKQILTLEEYYYNLQDKIEEIEIMSPSNYLLIRNISLFYRSLNLCKNYLDKWYKLVFHNKRKRLVTLYNNLNDSNILISNNTYLINWERTFKGSPIYDLYSLYLNVYGEYNYTSLYNLYISKNNLLEEEIYMLYILLLMPSKILLIDDELKQCQEIRKNITKIEVAIDFVLNNGSKQQKEE